MSKLIPKHQNGASLVKKVIYAEEGIGLDLNFVKNYQRQNPADMNTVMSYLHGEDWQTKDPKLVKYYKKNKDRLHSSYDMLTRKENQRKVDEDYNRTMEKIDGAADRIINEINSNLNRSEEDRWLLDKGLYWDRTDPNKPTLRQDPNWKPAQTTPVQEATVTPQTPATPVKPSTDWNQVAIDAGYSGIEDIRKLLHEINEYFKNNPEFTRLDEDGKLWTKTLNALSQYKNAKANETIDYVNDPFFQNLEKGKSGEYNGKVYYKDRDGAIYTRGKNSLNDNHFDERVFDYIDDKNYMSSIYDEILSKPGYGNSPMFTSKGFQFWRTPVKGLILLITPNGTRMPLTKDLLLNIDFNKFLKQGGRLIPKNKNGNVLVRKALFGMSAKERAARKERKAYNDEMNKIMTDLYGANWRSLNKGTLEQQYRNENNADLFKQMHKDKFNYDTNFEDDVAVQNYEKNNQDLINETNRMARLYDINVQNRPETIDDLVFTTHLKPELVLTPELLSSYSPNNHRNYLYDSDLSTINNDIGAAGFDWGTIDEAQFNNIKAQNIANKTLDSVKLSLRYMQGFNGFFPLKS